LKRNKTRILATPRTGKHRGQGLPQTSAEAGNKVLQVASYE